MPWIRSFKLTIGLVLVLACVSCTTRPSVVVLGDSEELKPVIVCPQGMTCAEDPTRWTIEKGYLNRIMKQLSRCAEAK